MLLPLAEVWLFGGQMVNVANRDGRITLAGCAGARKPLVREVKAGGKVRGKGRPRLLVIGNVLMLAGTLLMVGVGIAYGYSFLMEQQARSDPWMAQVQAGWQQGSGTPEVPADPTPDPAGPAVAASGTAAAAAGAQPTVSGKPVGTPPAVPPPVGMRIPAAGVDSRIVEVGIVEGEYEVPRFYVGWYRHTARPGQRGNGVYTGHVESLDKGQVFARLPSVKTGQDIFLYTAEGFWRYRISEIKTVRNDDITVMQPTTDYRITLITCTGTFDWASRQYSHRFVVVAKLVNDSGPERY